MKPDATTSAAAVAAAFATAYSSVTATTVGPDEFTAMSLPGFGDGGPSEMDLDSLGFIELLASVEEDVERTFADRLDFTGLRTGADLVAAVVAALA